MNVSLSHDERNSPKKKKKIEEHRSNVRETGLL